MKRFLETSSSEESVLSPASKVVLVEREHNPNGVALLNPNTVAKMSYEDKMELAESFSGADNTAQENLKNKLDMIGLQMKNLQDMMTNVLVESRRNTELHKVACNFVKKPGQTYHLYQRPSGQKYFSMLTPEEWQNAPHPYLGSFYLEADLTWTPANQLEKRHEGLGYLKEVLRVPGMMALMEKR